MPKTTLVAGVLVAVLTGQVGANSWYPPDCLWVDYCGPLENVSLVSLSGGVSSQLTVSSNSRTAVLQRTFAVGKSKDGRMHVCMRYDPFGTLEITCLLLAEPAF